MAITALSILNRAAQTLNDMGFDRWTRSELLGYLNDGQREIVKIKPDAKTETRTHALIAGAKQPRPADCIAVVDVVCNVDGDAITVCDKKTLDVFQVGWQQRNAASKVKHWMQAADASVFYVYPPQNTTPATVELVASVYPALVGEGNNIDVREIYADNLLAYVLYRALSKDAEFVGGAERAAAYFNVFKE